MGGINISNERVVDRYILNHCVHCDRCDQKSHGENFVQEKRKTVALTRIIHDNNIMRHLIFTLSILAVASSCTTTSSTGWGPNQRGDTLKGALGGATIGGIIGHQSGNRDAGILIGGLLGAVGGNNTGKNKDYQNRDHHLEDERARTAKMEYELSRARELQDLRNRQNKALREIEQLRD